MNLNNQFVVFGIRNLEESLRPVAMHIILDYIWTVIKKELKRRILVVDEAWYLMQYDDSAGFLRGIVKRGRKYYLGVTTITQDVDDFLQTPYGKEIVTNSAIQILLKQHSAAIDQIGEVFYLSEGEKQLLLAADKGEGIFFAGQNHVAIRVVASEDEHKLITSNPEEIMKIKQQNLAEQKTVKPAEITVKAPSEIKPTEPEKPVEIKKQLFETTVVEEETAPTEKPEEALQKRITEMEALEKNKIEEHERKMKEEAEQKKKETETLGGSGNLPKYKDLFINNGQKLPPLPPLPKFEAPASQGPPLPKFEPPKAETVVPQGTGVKPLFVNQVKEVSVPQPPQLAKKPIPVFENPATIQTKSTGTTGEEAKKEDQGKMDYDKLFGNGIV